jgi:RNA polymerase sigma factor (sigma-70 family)
VQEVLIKLVDVFRRGVWKPEKGRFRAYLATITRREVINRWQKAQARAEGRQIPIDDAEIAVEPEAAALLDAKWRLAQRTAAIEHVLTRTALAQKSKDIYRAYAMEERPIGEVAKVFGVSRNVVSQTKTRIDAMIADYEAMFRD